MIVAANSVPAVKNRTLKIESKFVQIVERAYENACIRVGEKEIGPIDRR